MDLSLDEELICAVCRDIFTEPVTLPCGHNYCESCVNELKRALLGNESDSENEAESRFPAAGARRLCYTCPLCLAPCDVTVGLRKNTVLHNIAEKWRLRQRDGGESVPCSVCKGELERRPLAESSCVTCGESYCALHVIPHVENDALRRHVLVKPVAHARRLCARHGETLELYCRTERAALCVSCLLTPHDAHRHGHAHDVVKLAEARGELEASCQEKLGVIKDRLSEVKDGLSKLEEASSSAQETLESQLNTCSTLLSRIRLFLELEQKAWQKRFSVDVVQEQRSSKLCQEKLSGLRSRLLQAHEALLQALSVKEPLLLLQTIQNADWEDLFDSNVCKNQILEALERKSPKPVAAERTSPLLQSVRQTFAGEDIVLNAASAHPKLRLNSDRSAVWASADSGSGKTESVEGVYRVLAEASFTCGIHHWEVEVDSVPSWSVGISYGAGRDTRSRLGEDDTSWALSYSRSSGQFCAQHDWLRFCFSDSDGGPPGAVGVFLDIDSGILSFYDAVDVRHLYTFYCDIQAPVYPAFCLGTDVGGKAQQMRVRNPISPFRAPFSS